MTFNWTIGKRGPAGAPGSGGLSEAEREALRDEVAAEASATAQTAAQGAVQQAIVTAATEAEYLAAINGNPPPAVVFWPAGGKIWAGGQEMSGGGTVEPPEGEAPAVVTAPSLTPGASDGGTSALNVGTATGDPAPAVSWVLSVAGYPDQSGTGNGTITWPNVTANAAFTLTVTWDNDSGSVAREISGTIVADAPANTAPTLSVIPAQSGTVGTAVSVNLASYASDAEGAVTFSATGLPAGLTLSAAGMLAGMPTTAGSANATITVTDAGGLTAQRTVAFTIAAAPVSGVAPAVTTQPTLTFAGGDLTLTLGAASGDPAPTSTWTFTRNGADQKPSLTGMTLADAEPGSYALRVTWTNASGSVQSNAVSYVVPVEPVEPVDIAAASFMHWNGVPTHTLTNGTEVATVTPQGTSGRVMASQFSGTPITLDAEGLVFGSGKRFSEDVAALDWGDRFIVATQFDFNGAPTGTPSPINTTGTQNFRIFYDATTSRVSYRINFAGTNVNFNCPTTPNTALQTAVFEIDQVNNTIRYWDGVEIKSAAAPSTGRVNFALMVIGQGLTGGIPRMNIFPNASVTMEQVLSEYGVRDDDGEEGGG